MRYRSGRLVTLVLKTLLVGGLTGTALNAQSTVKITGRVTDAETGESIAGANVLVSGTGYGATTDRNGIYRLEDLYTGEYTLQVSCVGYETDWQRNVPVRWDATTAVNFRLERCYVPLGEIIVTTEHPVNSETEDLAHLTSDEIRRSSATTVGELLGRVPGLHIIDEGPGSGRKRVSIRGSRSNQVLVLLDGVPLNDPLMGDVDLSLVPLSTVEEIHISKSGGSHTFGSGALGGVVQIITRQNPVEEVRLGCSYGDFHSIGINPGLSGTLNRLAYAFQYDHQEEEGDFPFTYAETDGETVETERRNGDFLSRNYFGAVTYILGRHEILLKANLHESRRGLPGLVYALTPYARAETQRRIFQIQHRLRHELWQWQANLSRHDNNTEFRHLPPASAPLEDRSQPPYHTAYNFTSDQGSIQVESHRTDHLKVGLQGILRRDRFEDENLFYQRMAPIGRAENTSSGFDLHSETDLPLPLPRTRLKLSTSIRFDGITYHHDSSSRRDESWSPYAALHVSQTGSYTIMARGSWGRSFRAPTFADLFYQDIQVRGNPDLKAESSENTDAVCRLGLPLYGWFEAGADYFHRLVSDLIIWRQGSFATFSPVNTDAIISGWEFAGEWKPRGGLLTFHANHLILDPLNKSGERTTHDKRLPYQATHTTQAGVSLEYRILSIDYRHRRVGERYVTEANTVKMGPYEVDDLSIICSIRMKGGDIRFKLSLFNLFDETYETIERAPLPGRSWRGSVEASF